MWRENVRGKLKDREAEREGDRDTETHGDRDTDGQRGMYA